MVQPPHFSTADSPLLSRMRNADARASAKVGWDAAAASLMVNLVAGGITAGLKTRQQNAQMGAGAPPSTPLKRAVLVDGGLRVSHAAVRAASLHYWKQVLPSQEQGPAASLLGAVCGTLPGAAFTTPAENYRTHGTGALSGLGSAYRGAVPSWGYITTHLFLAAEANRRGQGMVREQLDRKLDNWEKAAVSITAAGAVSVPTYPLLTYAVRKRAGLEAPPNPFASPISAEAFKSSTRQWYRAFPTRLASMTLGAAIPVIASEWNSQAAQPAPTPDKASAHYSSISPLLNGHSSPTKPSRTGGLDAAS